MSSLLIQVYWHLSPSCYFLYCYLDRLPQKCVLHLDNCLINEHPFQMQEDFRVQTLSKSFSPWSCDVCYIREIFFRKIWVFASKKSNVKTYLGLLSLTCFYKQKCCQCTLVVISLFLFLTVALNYQSEGRMLQLNRAKFSANGNCGYVLKPNCMCQGKKNQ